MYPSIGVNASIISPKSTKLFSDWWRSLQEFEQVSVLVGQLSSGITVWHDNEQFNCPLLARTGKNCCRCVPNSLAEKTYWAMFCGKPVSGRFGTVLAMYMKKNGYGMTTKPSSEKDVNQFWNISIAVRMIAWLPLLSKSLVKQVICWTSSVLISSAVLSFRNATILLLLHAGEGSVTHALYVLLSSVHSSCLKDFQLMV